MFEAPRGGSIISKCISANFFSLGKHDSLICWLTGFREFSARLVDSGNA